MTKSMHTSLTAIARQLQADYLPTLDEPLPGELKGLVAQLVALEIGKRGSTERSIEVLQLRRLGRWFVDPYRPELHYMRGPGPKWREKHAHIGVGLRGRCEAGARASFAAKAKQPPQDGQNGSGRQH